LQPFAGSTFKTMDADGTAAQEDWMTFSPNAESPCVLFLKFGLVITPAVILGAVVRTKKME